MAKRELRFYTYIAGSLSGTLYIGFTGNLRRRMFEHKNKINKGFSSKYDVDRLLYFERFFKPLRGIAREKELKGWTRAKKIALINSMNPEWKDLSADWLAGGRDSSPRPEASGRAQNDARSAGAGVQEEQPV